MPIFFILGALLALFGLAVVVALAIVIGGPLVVLFAVMVKKIVAPKAPPVLQNR
jgi:ABC-type phosphate transport system permease subunit